MTVPCPLNYSAASLSLRGPTQRLSRLSRPYRQGNCSQSSPPMIPSPFSPVTHCIELRTSTLLLFISPAPGESTCRDPLPFLLLSPHYLSRRSHRYQLHLTSRIPHYLPHPLPATCIPYKPLFSFVLPSDATILPALTPTAVYR